MGGPSFTNLKNLKNHHYRFRLFTAPPWSTFALFVYAKEITHGMQAIRAVVYSFWVFSTQGLG